MSGSNGLAGRVAIVTGGARNIGRALALGFARAGALPVIADLDGEEAAALAREVEAEGLRARRLASTSPAPNRSRR
jgi:NAD(P)-dependent dehydrogenase (short-subunit alcohol dehydrogenase family)